MPVEEVIAPSRAWRSILLIHNLYSERLKRKEALDAYFYGSPANFDLLSAKEGWITCVVLRYWRGDGTACDISC